jgi:hypothetical protein
LSTAANSTICHTNMVMEFVMHNTDFCLLKNWCKDTTHTSSDYVTFVIKVTIAKLTTAGYSVLNLSENCPISKAGFNKIHSLCLEPLYAHFIFLKIHLCSFI